MPKFQPTSAVIAKNDPKSEFPDETLSMIARFPDLVIPNEHISIIPAPKCETSSENAVEKTFANEPGDQLDDKETVFGTEPSCTSDDSATGPISNSDQPRNKILERDTEAIDSGETQPIAREDAISMNLNKVRFIRGEVPEESHPKHQPSDLNVIPDVSCNERDSNNEIEMKMNGYHSDTCLDISALSESNASGFDVGSKSKEFNFTSF